MTNKEPRIPTPAEQAVLDAMTGNSFDVTPVATYAGLPCDEPGYREQAYAPERYFPKVAARRGRATVKFERDAAAKLAWTKFLLAAGALRRAVALTWELWFRTRKS